MSQPSLPPALRGNKQSLSAPALAEVMALNGPRPLAFFTQLLLAWGVIVGAIALAVWADRWWVSLLAILVVGTRQNVLGLLVHEQTHGNLGGRWGDWIANLLCAYPLLVLTVEGYARVHLAHHRDFSKDCDPDYQRKSGPEWQFPKRRSELLKLFLGDLLMLNTLKLVRGKKGAVAGSEAAQPFVRRHPVPRWLRPAFLLTLVLVLSVTGGWRVFLLYWLLPVVSVLPALVRWGAAAEHEYNVRDADVVAATPLVVLGPIERLLLPNLNFGLHVYHHFFPGISFSQLPAVHRIFEREGLVNEANVFRGNAAYLRWLVRREVHSAPVSGFAG